MKSLNDIDDPCKVKFIKACKIASKAVAIKHNLPKSIKKELMDEEQLKTYEKALNFATSLMVAQNLGLEVDHVSIIVYKKISE